MKFRQLYAFVLALMLMSFGPEKLKGKPTVNGKWYSSGSGDYYRQVDRTDIARCYNFKSGSQIEFSTCTDWCGCMRMTLSGKYAWENDSVIAVTFTHEEGPHGSKTKLENVQKERLKISSISKGIKIEVFR